MYADRLATYRKARPMKNKKTAGVSGSHNILACDYIKFINYVKGKYNFLNYPHFPHELTGALMSTVAHSARDGKIVSQYDMTIMTFVCK